LFVLDLCSIYHARRASLFHNVKEKEWDIDLRAALNFGLSQPKGGGFPQFYGMTVAAAEKEGKLSDGSPHTYYEAKTVTMGDVPLNDDAVYSVATNDFLAVGGDGFEMFSKYARSEFGTLEEALLTCLATAGDAALQAIIEAT
jgi:hypothetical protein